MNNFEARARSFVQVNYPQATAAFLGGSAASGGATESSDLDILIVLPDEWAQTSFVETTRYEEQLVEAFVYGAEALQVWLAKGRAEFRPVLDRLIAQGVPLIRSDLAGSLAMASSEAIAAGPQPCDHSQLSLLRYSLSALVDDLEGSIDPGERMVVMATAWREAAELALLSERRWIGTGKWLLRELRASGDQFGLAAWADDGDSSGAALTRICRRVLDALGGHLQDGFVRGTKPTGL